MQTSQVRTAPGQQLTVHHAAPGSTSDDSLSISGLLVASTTRTSPGTGEAR